MQDGRKAVWSIPYVFVAFSPILKQIFIAYRSSKVSSSPDSIFEIHQLWQSGFSRMYSNCYCSCSFKAEVIKIGQSSHKMYSNNKVNFQESTTISNARTKKSGNLLNSPRTFLKRKDLFRWNNLKRNKRTWTFCLAEMWTAKYIYIYIYLQSFVVQFSVYLSIYIYIIRGKNPRGKSIQLESSIQKKKKPKKNLTCRAKIFFLRIIKRKLQFFGVIINLFHVYDDPLLMLNEDSIDINAIFIQHLKRVNIDLK